MTEITRVLAVPAVGAYYVTDLAALQDGAVPLAEQYAAEPVSPGFRRVREVAQAVSVGLVLSDGRVVWGDCVAVAYAGHSGRDPVFRTADGLGTIRRKVTPSLEGREVTTFREMAAEIEGIEHEVRVPAPEREEPKSSGGAEARGESRLSRRDLLAAPLRLLREQEPQEPEEPARERDEDTYVTVQRPLHTAIRYGVTQALLKAVALTRGSTMAEVIADEWELPQPGRAVPIHAQSGAQRRRNADKMIVRRVDSLPHALVEDIPAQLGEDGEELVRYVRWLKNRIEELGGPDYRPAVHLDLHGALGRIYDHNLGRMLGYLYRLESYVQPLPLRLESPMIMDSRADQIEALKTLREYIGFRNMAVEIVADEWANTLDDIRAFIDAEAADMIQVKMPDLGGIHQSVKAVLACRESGTDAFLGGSCAETDLSARVAAHVALATQPDTIMARPGMGVDEAISILQNEMTRTLALIKTRPQDRTSGAQTDPS